MLAIDAIVSDMVIRRTHRRRGIGPIGMAIAAGGVGAMAMVGVLYFASDVTPAVAQSLPGDPEAGHRMAREVCSICHVVESGQPANPAVGAPDFEDVADDPATTELALRVFFRTPHFRMPNFTFTLKEENDIISYILSLREGPRGTL